MRKFITAVAAFGLLTLLPSISSAQVVGQKTVQLKFFTSKAASVNQGANDSSAVSLGAATTADTTYGFGPIVRQFSAGGASDTLANTVCIAFHAPAAMASGESVCVAIQASANGVDGWRDLRVGTVPIGFQQGGASASFSWAILPVANSSTNATGADPVASGFYYGGWSGWPFLRVILQQDRNGGHVQQYYSMSATFPTVINRGPN